MLISSTPRGEGGPPFSDAALPLRRIEDRRTGTRIYERNEEVMISARPSARPVQTNFPEPGVELYHGQLRVQPNHGVSVGRLGFRSRCGPFMDRFH